jgi:hypothetical protein
MGEARPASKWPALNIERRAVDALKPYARNARTHSEEQVKEIAASIREWGWTQPILIDAKGGVIAGHGRLLAAKQLGIAEVPVIVARGWSAAQKRAYTLADNRLQEHGGWDQNLLALEFGELQLEGFDIALTGFDENDFLNGSDFAPNLDPESSASGVTAGDVAKAKAGLDGQFADASRQEIIHVTCPHCGETLSINAAK